MIIKKLKALVGLTCAGCKEKDCLLHELQLKSHNRGVALSKLHKQLELLKKDHPGIWEDYFSKNKKHKAGAKWINAKLPKKVTEAEIGANMQS